jgi:hypothetical protein
MLVRLGMEIFGGTYMRPRYSPCQSFRGQPNVADLKLFKGLRLDLGFIILVYMIKKSGSFRINRFAAKQSKNLGIKLKQLQIMVDLRK